jgi:hypothetical protein
MSVNFVDVNKMLSGDFESNAAKLTPQTSGSNLSYIHLIMITIVLAVTRFPHYFDLRRQTLLITHPPDILFHLFPNLFRPPLAKSLARIRSCSSNGKVDFQLLHTTSDPPFWPAQNKNAKHSPPLSDGNSSSLGSRTRIGPAHCWFQCGQ